MPRHARVAEVRSERLIEELLGSQGWDLRKPPAGDILAQQEYKDYPSLREALATCSKSGPGAGIPEYVLVDRKSGVPWGVFEAKPYTSDLPQAVRDVCQYGDAFYVAGYEPLAVAVAGTADDTFAIRVLKRVAGRWESLTYEGEPVTWIPNREQILRVISSPATDLRPEVPPVEVLKARAEEINGLLRESGLKDDFRPAAIGAIMLALWKSRGAIRRDKAYILPDINQACEQAFWDAGKPDLAKSLHVDTANEKLAVRTRRICEILERLNITTLTAEHDYIGALYEEFFRYTGGNTIGQYFTPRHVTSLMTDLCQVDRNDKVIDIACGTGGFLIAAMHRMQQQAKLPHDQIVKIVKTQLLGLEDEPVTAALCVANMILRGDGSTGVRRADAFDDQDFPFATANVGLMNPPFPHKKSDAPIERFVDRLMQALVRRGKAAIVVQSSLLVKSSQAAWRRKVLSDNTLLGVISLPDELFQPYASTNTAVLLFEAGVPHAPDKPVFFCRIANDGLRLKKGVRVPVPGSQMAEALTEYRRLGNVPGFCKSAPLKELDNWAPGAYIDARPMTDQEFRDEVATLIRGKAAFATRFAPQLATMQRAIATGEVTPRSYAKSGRTTPVGGGLGSATIGGMFNIYYGQKSLHSKENLEPGVSLVISSSGADNGAYGFFDFPDLIKAPFTTVPSTGSIGESAVQEFPCGVTDDCLLLFPRENVPMLEALYVAAATLRHERWRFNYGRKMTPERIANFPLRLDAPLLEWVREQWQHAEALATQAMQAFGGKVDTVEEPRQVEALRIPREPDEEPFTKGDFWDALRRIKKQPGHPSKPE